MKRYPTRIIGAAAFAAASLITAACQGDDLPTQAGAGPSEARTGDEVALRIVPKAGVGP
jgi:hypothetical protein